MPVLIRLNALVGTVTDDYIAQEGEVLQPLPEGFDLDNWEYAEGALRKKPVRLTRLDYMRRFTRLWRKPGIRVEARTDPMIEVILGRLSAAEYVDVTDTETVAASTIWSKGLLMAERKAEVLA